MDYLKVLRAMCDNCESFNKFMHKPTKSSFADFVVDDTDEYDDFTIVYESRELIVHCTHGATKAVLHIDDDLSVIKIGFTEFKINHAVREYNVFKEAKRSSIDRFFVPCEYIGEIFDNPIFKMDFVEVDEEKVTSDIWSRCSDSMSNDEISEMLDYEEGVVDALFPYYYGSECELLFDFISSFDINDLHTGNIGYDADGNIKLVDYSGYIPSLTGMAWHNDY